MEECKLRQDQWQAHTWGTADQSAASVLHVFPVFVSLASAAIQPAEESKLMYLALCQVLLVALGYSH